MRKILLVDDGSTIYRDALSLQGYHTEAITNVCQVMQRLISQPHEFGLLIVAAFMSDSDTLAIVQAAREHQACPVILLRTQDQWDTVFEGLRCRVDECLIKPVSPKQLLTQVESLLTPSEPSSGGGLHDIAPEGPCLSSKLLTVREIEVLKLLVQGMSNQEIADELVISEMTVKNHLASIFRKLNAANRIQAAYFAQRLQL